MKRHTILLEILAVAISAAALSGCGTYEARRSIHSVSINEPVGMPKRASYSDRASENVGLIAAGGGLLPVFIAGSIQSGMTRGPREALQAEMGTRGIAVEQMVSSAFAGEIQRSKVF